MSNPNIDFTKLLLQNIKDHPVYEDAVKVKASSDITLLWHGREQASFDIESDEVNTEIMLYFEKEDNQEWLDILIERDDPEYVVAAYMCYLESYSDVKSSKIRGIPSGAVSDEHRQENDG